MHRSALTCAIAASLSAATPAAFGGDCPEVLVLRGDADVDLTTGATTERRAPAVSYNLRSREYMVVWHDARNGNNDIFGQRVDLDGNPIGANFPIMELANHQVEPAIVHEDGFNSGYLVAWRTLQPGFVNKARGRLIGLDGAPLTGDFLVGEGFEISLAYNQKDPEFFMSGRGNGIRGQRVSIEGDMEGGSIAVATTGNPSPNGEITYNPTDDRFLATWRDQVDQNLKARRFTESGQPFGSTFVVSDLTPEDQPAATAFDFGGDRFLVVFGVLHENRIVGQFVTRFGTRDGSEFTIASGLSGRPSPVLTNAFGRFIVAWIDDRGLVAKAVLGDGTVCDETLVVAETAAHDVDLAWTNHERECLLTWTDDRNLGSGQQDIYARRIAFGAPCHADVNGDRVVGFGDLVAVLAAWGNSGGPEDIDGSGTVDFGDVVELLANWGPCV